MNSESLKQWALIAEIAGGLAVVVSLVFVGYQVRQSSLESNLNTRAIEANAYQALNAQIAAATIEIMSNPEFANFVDSIYANEIPAVEPIDRQVRGFLNYTVLHSDSAYNQYVSGMISEEQLHSVITPLIGQLVTDVGKLDWTRRVTSKTIFHGYIEEHMNKLYPSDPFWQKN